MLARELVESLNRALLDEDWVADDEVNAALDRVADAIFSVEDSGSLDDDPWEGLLIGPQGPGLA